MNTALKIITRLPLKELWRDDGFTTTTRSRSLSTEDITVLLRAGNVQFVVADVGIALRWIPSGECFDFWKAEAKIHIAAPDERVVLDDFPSSYCYFASEWIGGAVPIVVLEKYH